jgi:NTP pyrophosphatase (non-canonical NTP hydrolase)
MKQMYSVSVDDNSGFGFCGSYTKDELFELLDDYVGCPVEDYEGIIEDGGIDIDGVDINIVEYAVHHTDTLDQLLSDFNKMTLTLAKDGNQIKQELTPEQAHLLHMAIGISGESGELLDAIKKHTIYQKPLDVENAKEELGDLLFYMSNLMQSIGLSFEEVLQHNIDKLSVRYASGKYSNQQAQQRADKILTGETE